MICRVCNRKMKLFEIVNNCRATSGDTSLYSNSFRMVPRKDFPLFECEECGHIQGDYLLNENYYEEYADEYGKAQYSSGLDRREELLEKLSYYSNGGNIIEAGSGNGDDLLLAKKYFNNALGIEPSKKESEIAKKKGCNVINSFFDHTLVSEKMGRYDAFCSFQVLEHIENIYDVLETAYCVLADNGVGLINVPNGDQIFRELDKSQVLLEHVNYFTASSLSYAINKVGFKIIDVFFDYDAKEINFFVKKEIKKNAINETFLELDYSLHKILESSNHAAIYGAGAKTVTYSELIKEDDPIEFIFDRDENKEGKYIVGINLPIMKPSRESLEKVDAVIIFATSYTKEIIASLRNQYFYKGKIIIKGEASFEIA